MSTWLRFRGIIDRIVAAALLMLLAPLIALLGAVVQAEDGGPAFVRLDRVGRSGRGFRMWKLRTMRAALSGGEAGGSPLTAHADPRITRSGGWLRSRRLDELPQLLNVVAGDMALFGPRPETPEFVDLGDEQWQAVLAARPGIAGATQLLVHDYEAAHLSVDHAASVYADVVLPAKLAVDRWYVEHASPHVDLLIAVSLVQRFLLGTRSTALHHHIGERIRALDSGDPLHGVSRLLR